MSPDDINVNLEDQLLSPELEAISLLNVRLRFVVLRSFNRRVADLVSLVDLSCADDHSQLARLLRRARRFIFSHTKSALISKVRCASMG